MVESERRWKRETGESESGRPAEDGSSMSKSGLWQSPAEGNPYRDSEGIRKFQELYTGKRRQDRTAWSDYFLSGIFLKGWREEAFVKLLWEIVQKYQEAYPPCREFMTELYIAYGLQKVNGEFRAEQNALFQGIEYIVQIAAIGPAVKGFKKNDPAMQAGFRDYRELLALSVNDGWEDDLLLRLGRIIDCYTLSNLSDRPIPNADQYELTWRHPKSLRLITCFFRHRELPDQVYRILWNHLRLDTATNGREKLLYGELRKTALEHVPELGEKPRTDYKKLINDFNRYNRGSSLYFNEGRTEEERRELDEFFCREDVQNALSEEAFVEEQVMHYWINKGSGVYLLQKLRHYYEEHENAPYVKRVLAMIEEVMEYLQGEEEVQKELLEDEQSGYVHGRFDFQKRAYVRYYLNTAFHLPWGLKDGVCLAEYLAKHMPYSLKWSRGLTDPEKSGLSLLHPAEVRFGENVLSISFHLRYLEYRWNGSPKVPYFPGEDLLKLEDDTQFWLLAPVAAAPFAAHLDICAELKKRLSRLPVHKEDIPVIADCITGKICRMQEVDFPVLSLYAEKGEQLFGCDIHKNDEIKIYEEEMNQKRLISKGTYGVRDLDTAVRMGTRLLQELTDEREEELPMEILPGQIRAQVPYHPEKVIEGTMVTKERIKELLSKYFADKISRLELVYGGHSLLFLSQGKGFLYACFCFVHASQDWYGLVSLPEVYAVVESDDVIYVSFGFGKLPNYLVHSNTDRIRNQLPEIFAQVACRHPNPRMMMWSPQIYRFETRQRYRLAKRLYGGYPAEQVRGQLLDRFYLPHLPVRISYTEPDGTASGSVEVHKDKAGVQYQLSRYMQGKLSRLALTWQYELRDPDGPYTGFAVLCRHLVLLQDAGRYQMICLEDLRRQIHYLVADVQEYLDADEKRYRKETFLEKKVPGYLVHEDLWRIRDYLEMLLSEIMDPSEIIGRFGEFSYDGKSDYERMKETYLQ